MNGYRREQDFGSRRPFPAPLFNSSTRASYSAPRYETGGDLLRGSGGVFGSERGSQRFSSGAMHQPERHPSEFASRDMRGGSEGMLQARNIPRTGAAGPFQHPDFANFSGRMFPSNMDSSGRLFPRDSHPSGNMYPERSQRELEMNRNAALRAAAFSDRPGEVPPFEKAYRLDRESQRWVPVNEAQRSGHFDSQRDPREMNQAGKILPWFKSEAAKRRGKDEKPAVWEEKRFKEQGQFDKSRGPHPNFRQGPKVNEPAQPDPSKMTTLTESYKVGIVQKGFPEKFLTKDELTKLKQNILDKVFEQQNTDFKPVFHDSALKSGWLYINCAQKATFEWLKKIVGSLKPWEGADLQILDEAKIPREQILFGNFPDSNGDENEKILGYIKAQNKELDLTEWKVVKKSPDGDQVTVTLSVDLVSIQRLKSSSLKINYKFGHVQLRGKDSPVDLTDSRQKVPVKAPTPEAGQSKNRPKDARNESDKGKNQQDQLKPQGDDLRSVLISRKTTHSQNFKGRNWNDDLSDEDH